MQVFRDSKELNKDKNTVLTIGTFDGIHLGHQQIITEVNDIAFEKSSRSFFVTFDPHPRKVISPDSEIRVLTTLDEKINLLESYGIQNLFVISFTKEFSQLSSEEFFLKYIINTVGVNDVVIGHDHHFGKDRSGDMKTLEILGREHGFNVTVVDPFSSDGEIISSTKIRKALETGDLEKANKFLGRKYALRGEVIHGDKRGRELGFPTANLRLDDTSKLLPAFGIYAVEVYMKGAKHFGLMSIGNRPTFYSSGATVPEVYIYDFNKDIYGEMLEVHLVTRIRDEQKYSSAEALIEQMNKDKEDGIKIFNLFN